MSGIIPITTLSVTIVLSQYVYIRLLNYKEVTVAKYISGVAFSILLAYGVYLLRDIFPYFRFALMILILTSFIGVILKTEFVVALTSTIVSTGISYGALLISSLLSIFIVLLFPDEGTYTLAAVIAFALQSILIIFLFKIKRFKKGVTFLKSKKTNAVGLILNIGRISSNPQKKYEYIKNPVSNTTSKILRISYYATPVTV